MLKLITLHAYTVQFSRSHTNRSEHLSPSGKEYNTIPKTACQHLFWDFFCIGPRVLAPRKTTYILAIHCTRVNTFSAHFESKFRISSEMQLLQCVNDCGTG